jgi:anti-sigma regulatory factor (Ser/Thr protein kinase)
MPDFSISPRTSRLAPLRWSVMDWARQRGGVNADELGLVVTELVANAIVASGTDSPVEVSIVERDGTVEVIVSDCGPGLGPGSYPRPIRDLPVPDVHQPRGRGLFLVSRLVDSLTADCRDGRTIMTARWRPG